MFNELVYVLSYESIFFSSAKEGAARKRARKKARRRHEARGSRLEV
jgi:hypothetical protein